MYQTKYSVCPHDCPDTCGWDVLLLNGKIEKIKGNPDHPVTQGVICEKARYYPKRIYSKDRIIYPMKRKGPKGEGIFERISWDEALFEITNRWKTLIERYGSESILPYSYAGTEGVVNKASMDRRFFNALGSTRLERTICSSAGNLGYNFVYGEPKSVNPLNSVYSKLIIFWGINVLETNLHQAILADKARKNGAKIIVIDVHRNKTALWADEFFQILPGTDGALALGLMHIILRDDLYDREWTDKHTLGLTELKKEVETYTPERVAKITGLLPEQIIKLSNLYAENHPSLIRIGNGLQHHDNGGIVTWAISCLPAIVGAWKFKGGGAVKFNSGFFPLNKEAIERPDLLGDREPRIVNMNQLGRALTDLNPPIYSLYVYNSNPAVVAPEQNLVLEGLARDELFTVVHEQVLTDTAKWADIVLPATTHLEHSDLYISYWHCILQWGEAIIPPLGESKSNIQVFRELAEKMGFKDQCFSDSTKDIVRKALDNNYWKEQGVTFERLRSERYIELVIPDKPFSDGNFGTISGKAEFSSRKAVELGLPPVPRHIPLIEGLETATEEFPLLLISSPNHYYLNSTFANIPELQERAGVPTLEINPIDAARRSIHDGDDVEIYNRRGRYCLKAIITDSVPKFVVVTTGLWYGKGVNQLTPSRLSDVGNGATFFSNLVEVRRKSTLN